MRVAQNRDSTPLSRGQRAIFSYRGTSRARTNHRIASLRADTFECILVFSPFRKIEPLARFTCCLRLLNLYACVCVCVCYIRNSLLEISELSIAGKIQLFQLFDPSKRIPSSIFFPFFKLDVIIYFYVSLLDSYALLEYVRESDRYGRRVSQVDTYPNTQIG